jgi:hypothetical protein
MTYYWRILAGNPAGWGPAAEARRFATAGMATRQYPVAPLWNLVSLPLAVGNAAVGTLFPGAVSGAFTFSRGAGYLRADTLLPGVAYWIKFDSAQTVTITGWPVAIETVAVTTGWNLVGGISDSVDTALVVQSPPGTIGSPFYSYDGGYAPSQAIAPMRGYWVKATADGLLMIGGGLRRHAATRQPRDLPGSGNGR